MVVQAPGPAVRVRFLFRSLLTPMLPNACRSLTLLAFALVFSISCGIGKSNLVFADSHIVDDWDPSLQWNGGWTGFKDEPAPTWDRTLTWGNISSATVTFTFTGMVWIQVDCMASFHSSFGSPAVGTSIQVFGAFKPVGIWSMQSQYTIDGGNPTTFVPPQEVSAEAYNQSFYHSGTLSAGEHTLKITNLGSQLWLDYFLVNDNGGVNVVSAGGPSGGASTATTTATVIEPATATPTPSAGPTPASTGSSAASTSSAQSLPTQLNVSVSATNSSTPSTATSSTSNDGSLSSPDPTSPSPTSSDATAPARGAEATQDPSNGTSHSVSPGLIAGVTLGGLAVLAILLAVWWRVRRKQRGLSAWVAPYPFSRRESPPFPPHRLPPLPRSPLPLLTFFFPRISTSRDEQLRGRTRRAGQRRRSTRTTRRCASRSTPPRSSSAPAPRAPRRPSSTRTPTPIRTANPPRRTARRRARTPTGRHIARIARTPTGRPTARTGDTCRACGARRTVG